MKIKYQTKFIIFHTGILLLIILGVVAYFYNIVIDEMQEKAEKDFNVITEITAMQLDSLFYSMDRTALQIAANPNVVIRFQSLPTDSETNYFVDNLLVTGDMKKLLESYNFKDDGHARICLYNDYGDFICTSNRAITELGVEQFYTGGGFAAVQEFFWDDNKYIFFRDPGTDIMSAGVDYETDYFSIVREIKDYYSASTSCGYIEVQEPVSKIEKIFMDLDDLIYVEIWNDSDEIIYQMKGTGFSDVLMDDSTSIELDNAPYTIMFYQCPVALNEAVEQFCISMVWIIILIIIVAIVLEQFLIRRLSLPLVKLNRSLKSITTENLHVEIADEASEDIVLKLEESFNTMLIQLKESMDQQIVAKENEVKSHFFALQSQMNPHFLHNILAIISMEAQINYDSKIPEICERLGKILRYNAELGNGYSTLKYECDIAEDYMQLMKIRYEHLLEYRIELQADFDYINLPKFIIQPICENCFKHGLNNVEPPWFVGVKCWGDQEQWNIKISDNGSGFTEEFLKEFEELKLRLEKEDIKNILESSAIGGLCLPNIYARMKVIYKNEFIFDLYNNDSGAVVVLGGKLGDTSINSGR